MDPDTPDRNVPDVAQIVVENQDFSFTGRSQELDLSQSALRLSVYV